MTQSSHKQKGVWLHCPCNAFFRLLLLLLRLADLSFSL
jgi:hypothetical protein